MKFGISPIRRLFRSTKNANRQTAAILGSNNSIDQSSNTYIFTEVDEELRRALLTQPDSSPQPLKSQTIAVDQPDNDEREEIRRIQEFRRISRDGDSATALALLEKLREHKSYSTGYYAFRLNFEIAIIQQSIGEPDIASASLRTAYAHCPENYKAQTGLAFAELLDGAHQDALDRAAALLNFEGDHRVMAACVMFHAAKIQRKELPDHRISDEELKSPDVVAARLEYIQTLHPDDYLTALSAEFESGRNNKAVATMWALSILDDMKQNQAFLLGARMPEGFEENVTKSAEILGSDLAASLALRPPNKLLLPSQANNAAVALRLSGNVSKATQLVDKTLELFPELTHDLVQIRAILFLQEDRNSEALDLINSHSGAFELQIMASELEAQAGNEKTALTRIESLLKSELPVELLTQALATKARIAINTLDRNAADEAFDELQVVAPGAPELILLRSSYDRAFVIRSEKEAFEQIPIERSNQSNEERKLLVSLRDASSWDFFTILHAADELVARGYFRECSDLLRDRVSLSKDSPALRTLCDACMRGRLGRLAKELNEGLAPEVKNSPFGWKFGANVAYMSGEVAQAVPLTRKLFEHNRSSLNALEWYVQSLLRSNDQNRIRRIVKELDDRSLTGTLQDRLKFVNLLVFCGEVDRARNYAYRLFCENQNDHHAWMALSSSVLAFGRPPGTSDALEVSSVQEDSTFEVMTPSGDRQSFTVEPSENLFPKRDGNIKINHPVARAAWGKSQGDVFVWPFKEAGEAKLLSVKHKALAAFHMVLARFEERFPEASGFKSVSVNFTSEDGLDEMKAMLKQRADYAQSKAREYYEGGYPIYILGYHLGIDPIDAVLGLKAECGFSLKVSTCSKSSQDAAIVALRRATKSGILADACACYLMRRLRIEDAVLQEFGPIGVTQETIDTFSRRLREAESSSFFESDSGERRTATIAVRNGRIVMSELSEEEAVNRTNILRSDLEWLNSECEIVPAVAKTDPDDAVIRFRHEEGGQFFDDIFASDGSGRVLISDDLHLRQWADGLFKVQSSWIQALLFHLESAGRLPIQEVIRSTIHLCNLGQEALSTSSERVLKAVEMLSSSELSEEEFTLFSSLLGQADAHMRSHIDVAVSILQGLWFTSSLMEIRQKATSIILRNLVRFQGVNTRMVLDAMEAQVRDAEIRRYISAWRVGHFLT